MEGPGDRRRKLGFPDSGLFKKVQFGWGSGGNRASLVAQMVKNLPAMQETQVQPLGQENSLEEGMATHSSVLGWRIPWIEDSGRLQPMGLHRIRHG